MHHGETDKTKPNDSPTRAEHRITEEAAVLINQEMYDLDFEDETAHINFCFKTTGLQECTEVLVGGIGLQ